MVCHSGGLIIFHHMQDESLTLKLRSDTAQNFKLQIQPAHCQRLLNPPGMRDQDLT